MCRFLVYIGKEPVLLADLLTRPSHSIIQQSWDSRERMTAGPLNGDGFGVGWYAAFDPTPCIFTSINPAWNNLNLRRYPPPPNMSSISPLHFPSFLFLFFIFKIEFIN
jgi:glutamine amidotransferase